MWQNANREQRWAALTQPWDLIIVGGGITGVGILREAVRVGLRAVLIEQNDFASGTSSRSSKLIHGGLRYLAQGQVGTTFACVRERERLLSDAPGLIQPLGFLLASDEDAGWLQRLVLRTGLSVYDLLARRWQHDFFDRQDVWLMAPRMKVADLAGAFSYTDAQTDDARLVLRLLQEALADGGVAINYVKGESLLLEDGQVRGIEVRDRVTDETVTLRGGVVVNATGAWADELRAQVGRDSRMRPLRGSHLIFPHWRFPIAQAVSFPHPVDGRAVFALPWEGVTLFGTTDLDHEPSLVEEPRISGVEVAYLMAALDARFPALGLTLDDVLATFAGVRPVIDTGKSDPSKESRDHVVLAENGLWTVTGGKLTTFRVIAHDALRRLREQLPDLPPLDEGAPIFAAAADNLPRHVPAAARRRLLGRFGRAAADVIAAASAEELTPIPGTDVLWAEVRWAARAEAVVALDDLLLRRTRLGLQLPHGAAALHDQLRAICQPELGWSDAQWNAAWNAYETLWQTYYALPAREAIPAWDAAPVRDPAPSDEEVTGRRWPAPVWAAAALSVAGYAIYRLIDAQADDAPAQATPA